MFVVVKKKLKTTIFNDTHHAINIKFHPRSQYQMENVVLPSRQLVFRTVTSEETYEAKYIEVFLVGVTSISNAVLHISNGFDDLHFAKEIRIYELLDNKIRYRVSKVHEGQYTLPTYFPPNHEELARFALANKDVSTRMNSIVKLCTNIEGLSKQSIIFNSQCDNLVQIILKGIQELRNVSPYFEDESQMWTLYYSRKLKDLISSFDSLLRALMSANQLLQACSGKEWKRVALVLSMAPTEFEKYSGSWFSLISRDFNWSLDKIRYLVEIPHQSSTNDPTLTTEELSSTKSSVLSKDQRSEELKFMWIDHRCRYVLQKIMCTSGLTFEATTNQGGFDEDNVDQEHSESRGEICVATNVIEMHEDDVDQQAFECKDEIGVAAAKEESLKGDFERQVVDRNNLLGNIEKNWKLNTRGNPFLCFAWRLCDNMFVADETSNKKFSAVIRNRLEDTSGLCDGNLVSKCFEIDYLDLKMKKPISGGSFKRIYSANWLGQEVAVAMVQHIPRDVVEKEAGFLVKLHHPNVVDFFGFALKEEALTEEERNAVEVIEPKWTGYLVMELMQEDLRSLIDKVLRGPGMQESGGPFSLSITIDILLQIVAAMIHAQKFEMLHRDLKAKNCLVSSKLVPQSKVGSVPTFNYTVKLIYFGESKLWSKDGKHTLKKGTIRWMAPEVWQSSEYSGSADVYSFGMTCYEILTGLIPFQGIRHHVMEHVCKGIRPTIPMNCPQSLDVLMRKCWAHAPEERPSFEAIQKDLWEIKYSTEIKFLDAEQILKKYFGRLSPLVSED